VLAVARIFQDDDALAYFSDLSDCAMA